MHHASPEMMLLMFNDYRCENHSKSSYKEIIYIYNTKDQKGNPSL